MTYRKSGSRRYAQKRAKQRPLIKLPTVRTGMDTEGRKFKILRRGGDWFRIEEDEFDDVDQLRRNFRKEWYARVGQNIE